MVPAGNKAKRLSSVSHTTKTIHHHHHHHQHHHHHHHRPYSTAAAIELYMRAIIRLLLLTLKIAYYSRELSVL